MLTYRAFYEDMFAATMGRGANNPLGSTRTVVTGPLKLRSLEPFEQDIRLFRTALQTHAPDKEALLILAKALDLSWATIMALLFLGAPGYRIATKDLDVLKAEFARLDVETSNKVLKAYRSRKEAAGSNLSLRPQLHAV